MSKLDANLNFNQFLLKMCRPFRWHMLAMALISTMWAVDLSLRPYLIKLIVNILSEAPKHLVMSQVVPLIVSFLSLSLILIVFLSLYNFIMLRMLPRIRQQCMIYITSYMMAHSYSYYQNFFSGALANKIQDVSKGVSDIIKTILDKFVSYSLALTFAILTLLQIQIKFGLIMIVWSVVFFLVSFRRAKTIHQVAREVSETQSTLAGKIVDMLSNISSVRLFGGLDEERSHLNYWSEQNVKKEQRFDRLFFNTTLIQGLSFVFLQGCCLVLLLDAKLKGLVSIGDFTLVLTLNVKILDCLWNLSKDISRFTESLGKANQGYLSTTQPLDIIDYSDAQDIEIKAGQIVFDRVTFAYPLSIPLFKDLSIVIPGGQKVGLVGYSGSGKTTFVNLILRLFDIQSGKVLIDGQNIQMSSQTSLRKIISMIPQDPTIFRRSLKDNIRYGKFDASLDEIIAAAKKACAHDFIVNMNNGYDSVVGDKGTKLSGGQKQRIAVARAIIKDAPILILDEATSALDSITEKAIQENLWSLMQEKTTLVIAHRLSTLLKLDRILVFDKGEIVQDGTHMELIEEDGLYKSLWAAQFKGFLPASSQVDQEIPLTANQD